MYEIERQILTETPTLVIRAKLAVEEIPDFLAMAYGEVARCVRNSKANIAGSPFARYRRLGDDEFEIEAGLPLRVAADGDDEVVSSTLPDGPAAVTIHIGPYDEMEPAYAALGAWIDAHDASPNGAAWEIYYSDPLAKPDPSTWRTAIVQPFVENA